MLRTPDESTRKLSPLSPLAPDGPDGPVRLKPLPSEFDNPDMPTGIVCLVFCTHLLEICIDRFPFSLFTLISPWHSCASLRTMDWLLYEKHVCSRHEEIHGGIAWHWSQVPETVLLICGFMTSTNALRLSRLNSQAEGRVREFGLDGIALDIHGNYHGIQAKYWKNTLCAHHLGTFLSVMWGRLCNVNTDSHGYLYHTSKLQVDFAEDIEYIPNITAVYYPWSPSAKEDLRECDLKLHPPQKKALHALISHYTPSDDSPNDSPNDSCSDSSDSMVSASLLHMPCGTGKTTVVGHFLAHMRFPCIIVASPLLVHARQTLDRLKVFLPDYDHLLVNSDGRSAHTVIQPEKQTVISTTFESLAMLTNIDAFIVIDEAHNLSDELFEYVQQKSSLLVTATPPQLLMQHVPVVFQYTLREAIDDGLVCSYEVRLPVDEEINIPPCVNSNDLTTCALFLISGMLETGSKRCIVYCATMGECNKMVETFSNVCKMYHALEHWTGVITADTPASERTRLLADFGDSHVVSILASVRILNEGIDIPSCDSVCFTRTTCSETTAIQRMCRANRKDRNNTNKVAQVFIFSPFDVCGGMLASLKHCDPSFETRIRLVSGNYDTKDSHEAAAAVAEQLPKLVEQVRLKSATVEQIFDAKLESLRAFVQTHGRIPKRVAEEEVLGFWYKNRQSDYRQMQGLMRISAIKAKWEELLAKFPRVFMSDEEKWKAKLRQLEAFIMQHGRRPGPKEELGTWLKTQLDEYKRKMKGMAYQDRRKEFEQFLAKFPQVFESAEEQWQHKLAEVREFRREHGRNPKQRSEGEHELARWIARQKQEYKNKAMRMANDDRREQWEQFLNE